MDTPWEHLIHKGRMWGLFEHHTRLLDADSLGFYLDKLQRGAITNEEVLPMEDMEPLSTPTCPGGRECLRPSQSPVQTGLKRRT